METSGQESVYEGLRGLMFRGDVQVCEDQGVHAVLMDWNIGRGVASVLAVADGTASVYLSSGGGYLGGSHRSSAMRQTAIRATEVAARLLPLMQLTESFETPSQQDEVYFYLRSKEGVHRGTGNVANLRTGTDRFAELANLMQQIITLYRQIAPTQGKPNS